MNPVLAVVVIVGCLVVIGANIFLIIDQIKGGKRERDGK
jgi:hypothetical protein